MIPGLDVEDVLPAPLVAALLPLTQPLQFRRGQTLIVQGSSADEVFLVQSGRVRVTVLSANGNETFLRDMGPGRLLGELAAINRLPRSAQVVALEQTRLARLSASAFNGFLHDVPGAGLWLARQLAARVRQLTEKTSELAVLPVAARLLSELLRLAEAGERQGDACRIHDFPTHEALATRIGTHREAVTRELNQLARDGLLRQSGRRLDITRLADLACRRNW